MIIKQIFTELETEVKWYFDGIEEIVIVYVRNRLRGTFACACYTLRLYMILRCFIVYSTCVNSSVSVICLWFRVCVIL